MTHELEEQLVKAFPLLYRDYHDNKNETDLERLFRVGDGWFELIWCLSSKLERCITKIKEERKIDLPYLPAAAQVKSKFNELRFYMTHSTDEMQDLISKVESQSYFICQYCGKPKDSEHKCLPDSLS